MKIWIRILVIIASATVSRSFLKVISHILNEMKTITTKMTLASQSGTPRSSVDTGSTRCSPPKGGRRVPGPLVVSTKPGLLSSSWDAKAWPVGRKIPVRRQEDTQQPWVACEWSRKLPEIILQTKRKKWTEQPLLFFLKKLFILYWSVAD